MPLENHKPRSPVCMGFGAPSPHHYQHQQTCRGPRSAQLLAFPFPPSCLWQTSAASEDGGLSNKITTVSKSLSEGGTTLLIAAVAADIQEIIFCELLKSFQRSRQEAATDVLALA